MGAIETKTFRHGNSIAVDLPDVLGVELGERFTIERTGNGFTLAPVEDAAKEKRKLADMVAGLRALGLVTDGQMGRREPVDIPERSGL